MTEPPCMKTCAKKVLINQGVAGNVEFKLVDAKEVGSTQLRLEPSPYS